MEVYRLLIDKSFRADELQQQLGKDRSTVQRWLSKLVNCGMVRRQRHIIQDGGGHYYSYQGVPHEELISLLQKCINNWHIDMLNSLENFKSFR